MMMTLTELKEWRRQETERLPSIINPQAKHDCELTICMLNAIIGDI
jgi:hypothetical protein